MIRFNCRSCGKRLKIDENATAPGRCPRCGQSVAMPAGPTEVLPAPTELPPEVVAIPLPQNNPFELPADSDRKRRRRLRHSSPGSGLQNWHWIAGLAACAVVGSAGLWIHAEMSVQRIEQLRKEHEKLDAIYWRLHYQHADKPNWVEASNADPECNRARAELIANETEQYELINSPNFLVRWKLRK